jgi:hypothetical protein
MLKGISLDEPGFFKSTVATKQVLFNDTPLYYRVLLQYIFYQSQ